LPVIVLSQFCCTSLWFAGNAVLNDLISNFGLNENSLGSLTSSVQFGFIIGTLIFSIFTISDRFSAVKVFFISAVLGALCNLAIIHEANSYLSILIFRFLTGFFLAGIYPVGMKIASEHFEKGLGKALGFLVGALVLGTAFPHLINSVFQSLPWKIVIYSTSILALFGGFCMNILIPDSTINISQKLNSLTFLKVFKDSRFRTAALGYFGHMWELYAFWAFIPIILKTYTIHHPATTINIPLLSFLIIAIGALGCIFGGFISLRIGTKRAAFIALSCSGLCCLLLPLLITNSSIILFIAFLLFWGFMVVADSPLFSTLIANNAPIEIKGTSLTIVNCIGFSITIISIQLLSFLYFNVASNYIYVTLALGPILGLIALKRNKSIV